MRQKISPEIFRLENFNNNWKSKYTEIKKKEMSAFFFKSLEVKNFTKRFLRFYGLAFHNCKLALSSGSLHLFISYHTTNYSTMLINKENTKKNSHNENNTATKGKKKVSDSIKTLIKTYCRYLKTNIKPKVKLYDNKKRNFKKKLSFKYSVKKKFIRATKKKKYLIKLIKIKKRTQVKKKNYATYSDKYPFFRKQTSYTIRLIKKKIKSRRLRSTYVKRMKEDFNLNLYKNKKSIKISSFTEKLLDNLTTFVGKKYSVFLTFKHLKVKSLKDFYSKKTLKFFKENFKFKLYKYQKNEFFNKTKRVIFISIKKKNSAQFLANFISSQLNILKKQQYFFLKCIKNILKLVLGKKVLGSTKLCGIKIVVKGRLNKARRANKRTFKLSIGKVSLHHINANINHAKATSYTSNGTFGTEVWINYLIKKV